MLQQQLRVYEEIFKDLANAVREAINTQQKDINREFIPVITAAMEPAYSACVEERGTYFLRICRAYCPLTLADGTTQAPAASCA